ncbi:hypothetical protein LXL04_033321 [Taraxacum kok-saghyz]
MHSAEDGNPLLHYKGEILIRNCKWKKDTNALLSSNICKISKLITLMFDLVFQAKFSDKYDEYSKKWGGGITCLNFEVTSKNQLN